MRLSRLAVVGMGRANSILSNSSEWQCRLNSRGNPVASSQGIHQYRMK